MSRETKLNKTLIRETTTLLIIDSKHYPEQNANDLTIYLDDELENVRGLQLIYAGIPCTFYNVTSDIGNNKFWIEDKVVAWRYLTVPDRLYDLRSFNSEFSGQLAEMGLNRYSIRFSLQETAGKILIHFQKRGEITHRMTLGNYSNELLGFDLPGGVHIILPRNNVNPAVGDKAINFRPFEYLSIFTSTVISLIVITFYTAAREVICYLCYQ
jgi:hypothetical protein